MRIAFVSYHLGPPTAEGLVAARLLRILRQRGHEVIAWAGPRAGDDKAGPGPAARRLAAPIRPSPARWLYERRRRGWLWDKASALAVLTRGAPPDIVAWAETTAAAVVAEHRRRPFDLLHTRLNPLASHLAGLYAADARSDLPWAPSFSDPWPHGTYPPPYRFTSGPLSEARLLRLRRRILTRADRVIFPSDRLRDFMLRGSLRIFQDRAALLPHPGQAARRGPLDPDHLLIRHGGFLMAERRIEPLYEGLRRALSTRPDLGPRLRIEFAGRWPGGQPPEPPRDLRSQVAFRPWQPPDRALEWIGAAHVALLVEAALREGVFAPSKLSDYLLTGMPLLALSPAVGVVADLMGDWGCRAAPDAPGEIGGALLRLADAWAAGALDQLAPPAPIRRRFHPDTIGAQLEEIFDQAIAHRRRGDRHAS